MSFWRGKAWFGGKSSAADPIAAGPLVADSTALFTAKRKRLPCLLPQLQPVRHCLHPFLSAADAARLMRASRSITLALLDGYGFVDQVFAYRTVKQVNRTVAFYAQYGMRLVGMIMYATFNEPLLDKAGQPQLPPFLIALTLGEDTGSRSIVHAAIDYEAERRKETERTAQPQKADGAARKYFGQARHMDVAQLSNITAWDEFQYGRCLGGFNQSISPGALPRRLRLLQFGSHYDQPLVAGSIPDTVEALQFGDAFDQPLEAGHLPASLTFLGLGFWYNRPLHAGVLPAGLRQLHLGGNYNERIQPGVLPSQLQKLSFGYGYKQPIDRGVIPPSVTHVRLSHCFELALQVGSVPEGVVHLNLGDRFNQPLGAGVLPSSLRELVINYHFDQPLQNLPYGLEVLAFHPSAPYKHTLVAGAIPASVIAVSLSRQYNQPLVAGGIPTTVEWLRLPQRYTQRDLRKVLSPSTRVVWWKEGFK